MSTPHLYVIVCLNSFVKISFVYICMSKTHLDVKFCMSILHLHVKTHLYAHSTFVCQNSFVRSNLICMS